MERGHGHRPGWIFLPLSGLHSYRTLPVALERQFELARRCGALDDLGGRRLRGHAGDRL
jgi:hypothetical protein